MQEAQTEIRVSLYSRHAGANKEYHVHLAPKDGLWVVNYSHGKCGQALKPGTKTATPLPYEKALKKFQSLVNEKKNGESHYTEGPGGTAYQDQPSAKTLFGVYPQQPCPITRGELELLMDEPSWGLQEKANGENRTLKCINGAVTGGNKKGFQTPVPIHWLDQFAQVGNFLANGEHIGDTFYAFDLLEVDGIDLRGESQRHRYERLAQLHATFKDRVPSFALLTCHYDTEAKRKLLQQVESASGEGVVAKDGDAPWDDGRNKNTLKFVFRDVATCIVIGANSQRSVQIGLLNKDGCVFPCGNVTIPTNKEVPADGSLIDVKYLYYNGTAFEQPVYDPDNKGPRADVERHECTIDQILRFKPVEQTATS